MTMLPRCVFLSMLSFSLVAQNPLQTGTGLGRVTQGTAYTGSPFWTSSYFGFNGLRTGTNQWNFDTDGANNGGVVLAAEVAGFLRIIPIPTIGTTAGQTLSDSQLFDHTRMTIASSGVEIQNPASTGLVVKVPHTFPYGYAFRAEVNNNNTKSLVVSLNGAENFLVYGNGQVFAHELNVMTGAFPDYVFSPDYRLLPLADLREFITANHHLPGFPNGKEVEKTGMAVGDMQLRLVRQVEELTLYILEQQKRLAALEATVKALSGDQEIRIQRLESQLKTAPQ